MADQPQLTNELLAVLAKHGVTALPSTTTAKPVTTGALDPTGLRASYIREIITGDQAFDEKILARVGTLLTGK